MGVLLSNADGNYNRGKYINPFIMSTKNLGQVAGVAIQNTPPTNITLIWYDNTPSQMCHKVYDTAKKTWVIIDQKIISSITYSEIENIARQSGLPLGKFYQITDRNNTLALSISSTKVQYTDSLGNILIDDLGTNIQYHVSSSNLQIDDISGTFNSVNSNLVFIFEELENDINNDYILGKTYRNNAWKLFKFKLKSLISSQNGNSITWNNGVFLNATKLFNDLKDKIGGFVSYDTYIKTVDTQNAAINNVGKENQEIISNAQKALTEAIKPDTFYATQLPSISTGGEATDVAKGDTLLNIVSKIQRYINKFKYATGIKISDKFTSLDKSGKVNNNDTVETAIAKLQNQQSNLRFSLPTDWTPNNSTNQNAVAGEGYDSVFGKIEADRRIKNNLQRSMDVVIWGYDEDSYNLNYRVENGMLEIRIIQFMKMEWLYTRTVAYDYMKFYPFDFDEDFINQIKPLLFLPSGNDVARLIPLTTISLAKVANSDGWETPNYDIKALVSLAYSKYSIYVDDKYVEKESLGLSLTPISKISMVDGGLQVQEVNDNTTFQSLAEDSQIRYYIPPMLIRYKLF